MYDLCNLHAFDQIRICIYFSLHFFNEATHLEQNENDVGLAAFEWLGIFDPDYSHSTWVGGEEWITNLSLLVLDKWTSH